MTGNTLPLHKLVRIIKYIQPYIHKYYTQKTALALNNTGLRLLKKLLLLLLSNLTEDPLYFSLIAIIDLI